MSASSVSIMATNPEARQRAVKKATTAIEMLPTDVAVSPAGTAGEGRQPSSVREGRDLSHQSIRAGAVLRGTSNDLVPAKKASAGGGDSTAAPQRRTRKLVPKAKKPRWLTVLSVMGKNIGLWIVVWCLFQLIRMLVAKPGNAGMVSGDGAGVAGGYALAEFEGRIADIDDLLRMVQKRVDVVDKKIEEKGAALEKELKRLERLEKLEAASKKLEGNLATLKAKDWIQKGELDKVVEGLKKVKASGGLDIDEVKEFARKMIEEGIDKHAADGIGMVDYALASGGAAVVKHSEPFDVGGRGNWFSLSAKNGVHPNAEKMLKPSFGEPGQCFPLKDSSGFVQIRLRTAIVPEAITLEHVAKSVAYDRSSAPKDCRISGWLQGRNMDSVIHPERMFLLSEFTYDLDKSNAQTFKLLDSASSVVVDTVRLDFTSNHGSPSHTCIYRLRVHGHEPEIVSMMATQSL
ncbi:hypothetical protein HN51_063086 [Arachis hypogaea]|uniref:SUN domain-containing protein n=1 Tax=Arachis hypogaea TaxID=3818 RepID=A0A445AZH4_ARAHY|nr:protein SAD1/UNC-84 domain protein 1 isoform X2 [Arachis ipaensis]XP_025629390.1 SUN domain-containing protein 1 isoform X2 [Arachis hypogaea]QHO20656.1 Protein SAD1/UNC-84 domain protein [Arachis hypogaea]RYR31819.1 hypothetical protein Ahy_B01g056744 isoform A [Arachis hypogaea]RYR31820.1 hypothetical protein Ahy_B01g056744 isoform B [Arachis hypogaea]